MSDIPAYRTDDIPAATAFAAAAPHAKPTIAIEIADAASLAKSLADLHGAWADLLSRADTQNVFMDPSLLHAAAAADPAGQQHALLAWKTVDGARRLVGVWGFAVGRPRWSVLPIRVLTAPAYNHGYLATPVIDRDCLDEAIEAMLDAIAAAQGLPKILALDTLAMDGATHEALIRVLAGRGTAPRVFEHMQRPRLSSDLDGKAYLEKAVSSSTRKKLRQYRRRLAEKGAVTSTIITQPDAVRRAVDQFLDIEAAGWKGHNGTALKCNDAEAVFMRGAMVALAARGNAAIHAISVDAKPVSMQIVARAADVAFTWKTAYDEAYQDYSPGMLLLEDYTTAFLADRSIAFVDSCSFDDSGFMSAWTERRPVSNVWIDARRGGSAAFRMLSGIQSIYRDLRNAAKRAHHAWQKSRRKSNGQQSRKR
jgi:CelD/BcsL family acetyltransferase involved in cellulose biosynthesis